MWLTVESPVQRLRRPGANAQGGERVLITVGVHGNEQCGLVAVNQLAAEGFFEQLWAEDSKLSELTLMIGNPGAVKANARFVDVNLNRIFVDEAKVRSGGDSYEESLTPALAEAIDQSTWYLDLHSTSAPTPCFCIPASASSIAVSESLPVQYVLEELLCSLEGTTLHWASRDAGRVAVCVECGQHLEPESVDLAKSSIVQFLAEAAGKVNPDRAAKHVLSCRETQPVRAGFRYPEGQIPHAFQHVKHGELLALDDEGEIRCPFRNGTYLIMPTAHSIVGEEAWFWGLES
ncbi:unnamed protein product [Polarella glacialis]|uniref:Succinylglutamate desuccinylase/Aspartoacylase catalytic domain-containing protein n=1 Tax=Polarella glacialis TaxID=89957 RepID=A0A813FWD2_POLGL|nr:unnamed protein product [Polarella glacialis]CAE8711375.1 unnamed protein product [Polarella glacialis]